MLELVQLRQTVFCEVHPQKWFSMKHWAWLTVNVDYQHLRDINCKSACFQYVQHNQP